MFLYFIAQQQQWPTSLVRNDDVDVCAIEFSCRKDKRRDLITKKGF